MGACLERKFLAAFFLIGQALRRAASGFGMKTTEQTDVVGPLVGGRIGRASVVHAAA